MSRRREYTEDDWRRAAETDVYGAMDNTYVAPKGSGPVTCECGGHRNRCKFGRPHVWWFTGGDGSADEAADCGVCGAECRP